LIIKVVRGCGFELRDMEYWVDSTKVVGELELDGVLAYTIDDLEGSEVWFSEFTRRTSGSNEF